MSSPADAAARALDLLRGRPNPFEGLVRPQRPDDRFADLHHAALLRQPRELLFRVIDAYRLSEYRGASDLPDTRVVTVLGARGAGKTHMLEALAHREGKAQLLVRPAYYETQVSFDSYLLAHLVNALLSDDPAGGRPFLDIAAHLTRRLLRLTLRSMEPTDRLFAGAPDGQLSWRTLWGGGEALAGRLERLAADLGDRAGTRPLPELVRRHGFAPERLLRLVEAHIHCHEVGDEVLTVTRRQLYLAMARTALLGDGDALSRFLEADYTPPSGRPFFRGDVVKQRLHVLTEACALVQLPIIFAYDNLEGFVAPQGKFDVETARAFTDSLAQAVDTTRGLLFVIFAETVLFRQLQSHTQQFALDRLRLGVPVHGEGPIDLIELHPPGLDDLKPLIADRVGRLLREFPEREQLPADFPFSAAFLDGLAAKQEMGLRNRLLALREEYSRTVYGRGPATVTEVPPPVPAPDWSLSLGQRWADCLAAAACKLRDGSANQLQALHAGLGRLLQQCAPLSLEGWQLAEVRAVVQVGESERYGWVSLLTWKSVSTAGTGGPAPLRMGVGLLLGRGPGMANDLKTKFALFHDKTLQADALVVLWPRIEDDLVAALPSQTQQVWQTNARRHRAVLRSISDGDLNKMLAFPEWFDAVQGEADPSVPAEVLRAFVREQVRSLVPLLLPPVPERSATHAD
jgi:hypothetical protein